MEIAIFIVPTDSPDTSWRNNSWNISIYGKVDVGDIYDNGDDAVDFSYGEKSPNRNHTNETINAFRISSSGDIDGRNWIFATGSYGI